MEVKVEGSVEAQREAQEGLWRAARKRCWKPRLRPYPCVFCGRVSYCFLIWIAILHAEFSHVCFNHHVNNRVHVWRVRVCYASSMNQPAFTRIVQGMILTCVGSSGCLGSVASNTVRFSDDVWQIWKNVCFWMRFSKSSFKHEECVPYVYHFF